MVEPGTPVSRGRPPRVSSLGIVTSVSVIITKQVTKDKLREVLPPRYKDLIAAVAIPEPVTVMVFSGFAVPSGELRDALLHVAPAEARLLCVGTFTTDARQLADKANIRLLHVPTSYDFSDRDHQDMVESMVRVRTRPEPTKKQIAEAREHLTVLASKRLGRPLSESEHKVICGLDKGLVAEGEMARLFKPWGPKEFLDFFAEAGAGPGPVALLNSLASGPYSLRLGRQKIIEHLSPKGRKALAGLDFNKILGKFEKWLLDTLRSEPPQTKIRALYFGLFESKSGCQLYVSGANAYEKEASDWACASDWSPKKRYAPLDQLSSTWSRLAKAGDESWVVIQAIVIVTVRAFFLKNSTGFRKLTGINKVYVASGFDDGDLYAIRTPLSPKA